MKPPSRDWLSSRLARRSVWALALAGGLLGGVAVDAMIAMIGTGRHLRSIHAHTAAALIAVLCTTLLLAGALRVGLNRTPGAAGRTVMTCVLLGWLNCPLTLAVTSVYVCVLAPNGASLTEAVLGIAALIVFGAFIGVFIAAPLGLLYGVVAVFPVVRLRRLLDRPSHDAAAHAAGTIGLTVAAASLFATLVAVAIDDRVLPLVLPGGLFLIGALLALVAWRSARLTAQIHARLISGRHSGWERVPIDDLGEAAGELLPLTRQVSALPTHAIVRVHRGTGEGAYRTAERRVPWALVD